MSAANDIKAGRDALVYFHNEALKYPENYRLSFEELVNYYQTQAHGQFLEGFGFAITATEMSDRKVRDALIDLAQSGKGKLPAKWMDFFNAIQKGAAEISFTEAANAVLIGTARDIGTGLAAVGETVIDTAKNASGLVTMLPYVAFAGVIGYVYFRVKK